MLRASYEFAEVDMAARQLAEAKVEAEQLVEGVQNAIAADGDLLSAGELTALRETVSVLDRARSGDDLAALRAAIELTGKASEQFAARRMDRSIRKALSGVSLDALDEEA
jgi:molecular chaperone HscA